MGLKDDEHLKGEQYPKGSRAYYILHLEDHIDELKMMLDKGEHRDDIAVACEDLSVCAHTCAIAFATQEDM